MTDSFARKEDWGFMEKPWNLWQVINPTTVNSVDMHYSDSIEINLFHNVTADVYIGGKRYSCNGDAVFFIAPNVVHSFAYSECNGIITALKVNPHLLKPAFDIDAFLSRQDISYLNLPICMPNYEETNQIIQKMNASITFGDFLIAFLNLIMLFIYNAEAKTSSVIELNSASNDMLHSILRWTQENFTRKISIDEVSATLGYSKSYFCRKFKSATGMTYVEFVNYLRIHHAHRLLKNGYSISQACDECGFDDASYFIKLFKKHIGLTPKKFIDNLNE